MKNCSSPKYNSTLKFAFQILVRESNGRPKPSCYLETYAEGIKKKKICTTGPREKKKQV